jgi:ABC-type glycerol-3-phosphate transport system permease component
LTATDLRVVPAAPAPARWLGRVLAIAVLVFFSVFFIIPLAWLLLAPTKSTTQLNGLHGEQPFSFGSFDQLAENWNILTGFQHGIIWTWLGNSVLYSGVALVITIIVAIPAGYALAMTSFKGRRLMLIMTLMVMLIPNSALALPIFLELSAVHLVNSPLAVILPFSFFPFGMEPGSAKMPVQVGLAELISSTPVFNPTNVASLTITLPQLAFATLISVAPVLIIFLFSQRFLVTGLTAGATKE